MSVGCCMLLFESSFVIIASTEWTAHEFFECLSACYHVCTLSATRLQLNSSFCALFVRAQTTAPTAPKVGLTPSCLGGSFELALSPLTSDYGANVVASNMFRRNKCGRSVFCTKDAVARGTRGHGCRPHDIQCIFSFFLAQLIRRGK
jgi:hypothetical protein